MFSNIVDEKKLAEEAARNLQPLMDAAIAKIRADFLDLLDNTEIRIQFVRKETPK